jgi:prepilin-type N-terminal cleavage/methylation domain-containing protein
MKIFLNFGQRRGRVTGRAGVGFTLVEMMISLSIFSLVTIGMITLLMFGQRYDQLIQSKLGASDESRRGFNDLTEDIRSAKIWQIGNGSASTFTAIANGSAQQGNALKLNLTVNTNFFIVYYFDTSSHELLRRHSSDIAPKVIAGDLTNITANSMTFRAENYRGDIQKDLTHKGVINAMLEFAQYQYPLTKVGPGLRYDYYKIEIKATPHVPDGP